MRRDLDTSSLQQGGQDIHGFHNFAHASSAHETAGRPTQQQRHPAYGIGAWPALAETQMFAQPFAVIRGEDHDGVFCQSLFIQCRQDAPHVMVDFTDHGVVAMARGAQDLVGETGFVTGSLNLGGYCGRPSDCRS